MSIGYRTDSIFLLSIEEYDIYKNAISLIPNTQWWLRSPSVYRDSVAVVFNDGSVDRYGISVVSKTTGCRPAIVYENLEKTGKISITKANKFEYHGVSFSVIDIANKLAIADSIIVTDYFDMDVMNSFGTNNYATSSIRLNLLSWFYTGVWEYNYWPH